MYAGFELGERADKEIHVLRVRRGSPAEIAGLRKGDVIVSHAGEKLSSLEQLRERFTRARPADTLPLSVLRKGSATEISVTLWGKF